MLKLNCASSSQLIQPRPGITWSGMFWWSLRLLSEPQVTNVCGISSFTLQASASVHYLLSHLLKCEELFLVLIVSLTLMTGEVRWGVFTASVERVLSRVWSRYLDQHTQLTPGRSRPAPTLSLQTWSSLARGENSGDKYETSIALTLLSVSVECGMQPVCWH